MNTHLFNAPWLLSTARVFTQAGLPLYAVGGLVRNAVMELPPSDVDVCGPARPEAVIALCEGTPVHAVPRAAHFGTVELHVHDEQGRHMAEYTTFREDSYRTGHQPVDVRFTEDMAVDALRRDFSVNAMYRRLWPEPNEESAVIDPTGGLTHLKNGILHTVTQDPDQVLKDDGLRILRTARFQAELGLTPDDELLRSATKYAALLADIACERIRDELARLLLADTKYPMLQRSVPPVAAGLRTLQTIGAWDIIFGSFRANEHAIIALDVYQPPLYFSPVAGKMALLFMHEQPAEVGNLLRRLRFSTKDAVAAERSLTAMRALLDGSLQKMAAVRLGVTVIAHAAAALEALKQAGEPCDAALDRAQVMLASLMDEQLPMSLRELAVHGDDLLPVCARLGVPTARIGATLDYLWEAVVNGTAGNQRAILLAMAQEQLKELSGK